MGRRKRRTRPKSRPSKRRKDTSADQAGFWAAERDPKTHFCPAIPWSHATKVVSQMSETCLEVLPARSLRYSAGIPFLSAGILALVLSLILLVSGLTSGRYAEGIAFSMVIFVIGAVFTAFGWGHLYWPWTFILNKESNALRMENVLFKHRYPLDAIQNVELRGGKGFTVSSGSTVTRDSEGSQDTTYTAGYSCSTTECCLVLKMDTLFRLSLWDHGNRVQSRADADRLAEFLDVPICGNALEDTSV